VSGPSSEAQLRRLARPVPLNGVHPVPDWPWAQARVNFAVVGPRKGSRWRIRDPTVRGESPTQHSTVRFHLEDDEGRRLRTKQYYNDWWIPTVADISFRGPGRPVAHGESVAFVGRDYRRHDASCGHRLGTATEFSVEAGTMGDADWAALWSELDALDPTVVAEARATSFAKRNYWNRWRRTHAPWDTSEISSLQWSDPTSEAMERAAWALTADRWAPVPGTIDSLGFRTGPQGEEVQMVFRWPMTLDCSAWLRVLRSPPEDWRPLLDASEVNRPRWERVTVAGHAVERASMDPTAGNWFYAWREGALAYEFHLRARKGLGPSQADAAVKGLRA
jgi:hypothetical protein